MRHPRQLGLRYAKTHADLGSLAWDILITQGIEMRFSKSSGPFRVGHPRHSGIGDALK